MNKYLIFRTDRIGDFLVSAILIKSIKKNDLDAHITIISSNKNYSYIKNFPYVDEVYKLDNRLLDKLYLIKNEMNKNYKSIIIHDNKTRSKIISFFLKSKSKIFVKNQENFSHIDIIKVILKKMNFSYSEDSLDIFSFKKFTNTNKNNFIQLHFDEKWIHNDYIKKFINIEPNKSEIINFIINLKRKSEKKLIITTGKNTPNILKEISHLTKELDFEIYENLSFNELETITMKSKILISCHGAISHVAAAYNIKQIDIIDGSYNYGRWTSHFRNYNFLYREKFSILNEKIIKKI